MFENLINKLKYGSNKNCIHLNWSTLLTFQKFILLDGPTLIPSKMHKCNINKNIMLALVHVLSMSMMLLCKTIEHQKEQSIFLSCLKSTRVKMLQQPSDSIHRTSIFSCKRDECKINDQYSIGFQKHNMHRYHLNLHICASSFYIFPLYTYWTCSLNTCSNL